MNALTPQTVNEWFSYQNKVQKRFNVKAWCSAEKRLGKKLFMSESNSGSFRTVYKAFISQKKEKQANIDNKI